MSEVKTYAVNCNDAWLNTDGDDISGSYVKYADYMNLATKLDLAERACAALAAENAGLKTAHPQPFGHEMMKALDAYEKHQDEVPEAGMLDAFFILRDSIRVETPVTDAFLAEIERKAIRKFINSIEHILRDKLSPYDTEEMLEAMRIFLEEQSGEQK
jgi:hypothetical protein